MGEYTASPGRWFGRGAAALDLGGEVTRRDLLAVWEGRDPRTRKIEVLRSGTGEHVAAVDCTFSAPKSVSVIWATSDSALREQIETAQTDAVNAAIDHIESTVSLQRRRVAGDLIHERSDGLVAAIFRHHTSRLSPSQEDENAVPDPQLHDHVAIANMAKRPAREHDVGTIWGAIDSRELYRVAAEAGAVYRAELASRLQGLGFQVERESRLECESRYSTQTVTTTVAVNGNLKLGRYTATYQDMNVPVSGFPMQVLRTYDSDLAQRNGDIGNGWHVSLSNFTASSNRQLGAGGWTLYPTSCVFGLCSYGYKSSAPHFVTVTWPDGHQEVFDFTPTGGSAILYTQGTAGFTARPGTNTTSSLQIDGDQSANYQFDGNLYNGSGIINPTRYDLTTRDGTKLVIDTTTGLVSETDRDGNSLRVDGTGIHSSAGPAITFTRDGSGRITQVTGPVAGQTLTYAYDGSGNLATMTDPVGNVVTNTYDGQHHLLTTTGQGRTRPFQSMTYDASGRLIGITDANGNTTAVSDNVAGRQQTVTDPNGLLTTVDTFDDKGDLLQEQQHTGSQVLTTTATYDADGRPLTRTDPAGHTWTGTYDAGGDITSLTLPSGHQTAVTYNSSGAPLIVTDAIGHVTTYAYDGTTGSLVSVRDANGNIETFAYDAQGHLITKTDALSQVTTYAYDGNGNLTSTTDPLGHTTTSTYDTAGHLLASTDALGHSTQSTYDGDSQLLTVTDPLARVTTYTYNDLHKGATKKDAAGNITSYGYDAAGHLTQQTDPLGHATTYGYDVDGRYNSTADALGHTTTFATTGSGSSSRPPIRSAG